MDKKRFGATVICRNNEDVIERMIDSLIDSVDELCICDTGSIDNTLTILQKYKDKFESVGKRLLIYQDVWKNFGYNRTLSMRHAREMDVDYFMIIDSDESAEFKPNFLKNLVHNDFDYYEYIVMGDNIKFNRYGVFKNNRDWKWEGYAHNQVVLGDASMSVTEDIIVKVYPHTKYSGNHNDRSIKLLEQEIKDNGENNNFKNTRPYFYLAQLYVDCGRNKDALELFNKVLDNCKGKNCSSNFNYYSNYMIGILILIDNSELGITYLLKAYNIYPNRAEPLYIIGKYYREKFNYYTSEVFLTKALQIKEPKLGFLIQPNIYSYLCKFELSLSLYYIGNKTLSLKYMQDIDKMVGINGVIKTQNKINMGYL